MSKKDKSEELNEEQLVDAPEVLETADAKGSGSAAEELNREVDELKDKYLRLRAEFDNFKKRTIKERIDLMKMAAQDTLTALLPVLDDFDRAKKIADDPETTEHFSEGVGLVYQKLYSVLKQRGLEPMDTDGEAFDPELHEAVTEIPAPTKELQGKIIDTIEKGYKLNDRIIRHAKVVVGK
ncbi:MAG: nucleotide exchange factor GrpE [Saprospiraceae bacterium]|nr:nucleotide exchange factor GrpE [Saprospiraceae bacterium]MCB0623598.1 nucleotide exchange factor GrpE [Saprospiraceae bacterium]MCB0677652.1 nucleotide exchange factor GrpE [Saprospiraceae bacterium]MCB0682097.1 nucleotide exchange factor GrpE [Saprospiraceae bacterium]